jgi:hypothetical protein
MGETDTAYDDLLAERTKPERYAQLIANSTHGPEIEAGLTVLGGLLRKRHEVYVDYLKRGGRPGNQMRSPRWRDRDAAVYGGAEVMAALLGAIYPSPHGKPPVEETLDLVRARAGSLCNGWPDARGGIIHPSGIDCDLHPKEGTT